MVCDRVVLAMRAVRIGAGAGYSGDRIEPAVELAEKGGLHYLVFECLAERTIALAQQARRLDPGGGYDPLLTPRLQAVLPACVAGGVRIVTNMGAANPLSAAREAVRLARRLGLRGLKVAAVTGDDVTAHLRGAALPLMDRPGDVAELEEHLIAANAYLGAAPIAAALTEGADIVITGRVGDPAMFLAPLVHRFGWAWEDWNRLGKGILVGHLLECAGQITGGYFADLGLKDVPGLARLGFPLAEVSESGDAVITKVPGSGGQVTPATCKEQLLYEVHNPERYLQADVVADFSHVRFVADGPDQVAVHGGTGTARTGLLKVSLGYADGFIGEGQISYAGAGALDRARLAQRIVEERFVLIGLMAEELRYEMIGVDATYGGPTGTPPAGPEVRLRIAGRAAARWEATRIGNEVEALYTNGPAGGGGAVKTVREVVAVASTLIPEKQVRPDIHWERS
jgi:hypothetical protein